MSFLPRRLFALFCVCLSVLSVPLVPAHSAPPKKEKPAGPPPRIGREMLVIDGAWQFQTDPRKQGESIGWENAAPESAKTTNIPAVWDFEAAPKYRGVAWYWRTFEVPSTWKGQTIRLRFDAVGEQAHVWLNGQELGLHRGGATPFEFNVTKTIKLDGKNLLAIRVESEDARSAGLWQGVSLLAHDEGYMADVFPQAEGTGRVIVTIEILNLGPNSGGSTLDGIITTTGKLRRDVKKTNQNLSITPGRNLTTLETGIKRDLQRWSLETPALFSLQLIFRQDKDILDTQQVTFGFRQFGMANNAITLNGEPVKLRTLDLTSQQPFLLATQEDVERARTLLRRAKEQGVTVVYLAAPAPAMLRVADEEGILVVESARPLLSDSTALKEMKELIVRDRGHACLLGWNLNDVSLAEVKACRALDSTRFLIIGAKTAAPTLWPPGDGAEPVAQFPSGLLPTALSPP